MNRILTTAILSSLAYNTYAAEYTDAQRAMQYLLVAECVVASPDEIDGKLAYLMEYNRDWHDVKRLLEAGADPNGTHVKIQYSGKTSSRPQAGIPYLVKCVMAAEDVQLMKMLIDAGAEVNLKMNNNVTLLHLVSEKFDVFMQSNPTRWMEFLDMLLKGGVNINQQTGDGVTALMIAASKGELELVKYFMEKGADSSLPHSNGNKAINFVPIDHKNSTAIRQLLNSTAK